MVEHDLGGQFLNPDGTRKTLDRMRDLLFRQGAATLLRRDNHLLVRFLNSYRVKPTNTLRNWFETVSRRNRDGIRV